MKKNQNRSKIAVVIVTYNGREYLDDCLGSVCKQTYRGQWKIIIVDNSSTDGTVALIRDTFPQCSVIKNDNNVGFAEANNIGIRYAWKQRCDAVVLLNQDTIVAPDWLETLVAGAYAHDDIGAAQSLILLWPERHRINSAGNKLHYLGFGYTDGYRMKKEQFFTGKEEEVMDIAYPSGASVLLKKKALDGVGLFDASFFMYHEDLDLGLRLRMAGWNIVLIPASKVWHKYSFEKSITKYYYMERNRWMVLLKNYQLRTLILLAPALILTEAGLDFFSLIRGYAGERLRAYTYFFHTKHWKQIMNARKKTQHLRRLPDRDIAHYMSSDIQFQDIDSFFVRSVANPFWRLYWKLIKPLL